ncbi:MAG: thioredoxin family protein [Candidatus Heimdallarchaeota archaeon]|nr:thioredoxin family protein [Candidatus Heimdallarchaeota archaeon]
MTELKIIIASGSDSWCSNCEKTNVNLEKVLKSKFPNIAVTIDHINITNPETIKRFGTLLPPALIINDFIVHDGSIPSESLIEQAIKQILES